MIGLSQDIEDSINIIIEGLEYDVMVSDIDAEHMQRAMAAKKDSFVEAKTLLNEWVNSSNRPHQDKIIKYAKKLVKAGDSSIIKLRKALKAKIDYKTLPPEKHAIAIKSKSIILRTIRLIDSSLIELRVQIASNKVKFGTDNYKLGFPERFANGDFYPEGDYHKEWFDKDTDSIMLCPKGTKGKVITIEGLNIMLPKVPAKKYILNSKKKKEDQFWKRQELPKGLTPTSADSFTDFILDQFRIRREGIWFMNNGEPIYLPGPYWFALQWGKMLDNGGYMDFREAQLSIAYHQQACQLDPRSLGELFVKSRRTGATYLVILSRLLEESTRKKNGRYGLTSKSGDDAQEAFKKFAYAFTELPFFFQPIVKGKTESEQKLYFGKPPDTTRAAKLAKDTSTKDYLNTEIDYRPTKNDAYDSMKLNGYLGDECFAEGTKILMSDLSFKKIEDISNSDKVMNSNGNIIKVSGSVSGLDDMYKIYQEHGTDYIVSKNHKLLLENESEVSITPLEYLSMSKDLQSKIKRRTLFDVGENSGISVGYHGYSKFYGITLETEEEGERSLVLEDYTISRNCGKWKKPENYVEHFGTIKPTMMPGGRVVGKCWLCSTVGALEKGGENFRTIDNMSDVYNRAELTGNTASGLYSFFLPAHKNQEICTDKYGKCWEETPPKGTLDVYGEEIRFGSIEYLKQKAKEAAKEGDKVLNAFYRAEPMTREHAYRDKSDECEFNINKLYEQIDYNNFRDESDLYTVGNFAWKDGIKDSEVIFTPNKNGRFKIAWMPSIVDDTQGLANKVSSKSNKKYPLNNFGFLSSDPFSVRSAAGGKGSSGAIHGFASEDVGLLKKNDCFLEYLCRARTEDIFFEDVVMALHFYGIKILAELNRVDLLRYVRNRGYRPFSESRLDRTISKLSDHELEYGGQQMSGVSILDDHLTAINSYIDKFVGVASKNNPFRPEGQMGKFPFNETLKDWMIFNPEKRTKHDASISSGLGIMAINKDKYKPKKVEKKKFDIKQILETYKH